MCKYFFLSTLLIVLLLAGCNSSSDDNGGFQQTAMINADTIYGKELLKKYMAFYDLHGDMKTQLLLRQKYGSVMRNHSQFDSAVLYHKECIDLALAINDTLQLIIAYNNQGTNYRRIGDVEEAINYHYEALKLCDKIKNDTSYIMRKNRVRTFNGLGNVMLQVGRYTIADSLFRRALTGEKELNSYTGQAINLANIGAIKEKQGELDSAHIYYSKSMEFNMLQGNKVGIALCYQNIGNIYEKEGNNMQAREYYLKSYELGKQTADLWHWLNPCTSLAVLSLNEGNLNDAQIYCEQAIEISTSIKAIGRLGELYAIRALIYEAGNDYKMAYESNKLSQVYKDSANIDEGREHAEKTRINYEIQKQADKLKRLQDEAIYEKNIRQATLWVSGIIIMLIIIAIIMLQRASILRKHANEILKKTNKERTEFYRQITHQLRTPLTILLGMTEELKKYIPEENKVASEEFKALERKSNELNELISEMIEFNKGKQGNITLTELYMPKDGATSDELLCNNDLSEEEKTKGYILVAEDDRDVALLITQILKNKGYNCRYAENGLVALNMLNTHLPLLLVTDIKMPQLDGLQLIKKVRNNEKSNHLPIIAVSARADENDRLAGLNAGAEAYLCKPFAPSELMTYVQKLLEHREILKKKYGQYIHDANMHDNAIAYKTSKKSDKEFIQAIDSFIHENIMDCGLNAAILANHMAMSVTTLNRRINSIANTNTTNYIRIRRLTRAKYLLQNSNMSMGEIQAVCGFESPSYFSRAFRSEYKLSPSEFRKTTIAE